MNDTPETDLAWSCFKGYTEPLQDVKNLSRKLERERDEAREMLEKLSVTCYTWEDNWKILARELDEAREQRDRLAEVLLALRDNESFSIGGAAYEIIEQALQSLHPNAKPTNQND